MHGNTRILVVAMLSLTALPFMGCTQVGDPVFEMTDGGSTGGGVGYDSILPIFQSNCTGCHTGGAALGGLNLDTAEGLATGGSSGPGFVVCDPDSSEIVIRVEGSDPGKAIMPPPSGGLSTDDIDAIRRYIASGAGDPTACGSAPTFDDIADIFSNRCFGCHVGGAALGGLSLDDEAGLLAGGNSGAAIIPCDSDNSLLICRVEGSDCGTQMPQGGNPLDADIIARLRAYVDGGAGDPNACSGPGDPAHCSDGTKNEDEGGIDCGGSCSTACPDILDYETEVKPIFDAAGGGGCANANCHGQPADTAPRGFNFSVENMLKDAGATGASVNAPLVIPCDADNSLLFKLLNGPTVAPDPEVIQMPNGGPYLDAAQIAIIKQWIDEGAQEVIDPAFSCPTP